MSLPDRRTPEVRESQPGVFVIELPRTRRRPAEELGVLVRSGSTWTALGRNGVLAGVDSFHEAVALLER